MRTRAQCFCYAHMRTYACDMFVFACVARVLGCVCVCVADAVFSTVCVVV